MDSAGAGLRPGRAAPGEEVGRAPGLCIVSTTHFQICISIHVSIIVSVFVSVSGQ